MKYTPVKYTPVKYTPHVLACLCLLPLAACQTPVAANPGFSLPPTDAVIGKPEPRPVVRRGDNLGTTVLKFDGALNRANTTISQGRANYERVRVQASGQ